MNVIDTPQECLQRLDEIIALFGGRVSLSLEISGLAPIGEIIERLKEVYQWVPLDLRVKEKKGWSTEARSLRSSIHDLSDMWNKSQGIRLYHKERSANLKLCFEKIDSQKASVMVLDKEVDFLPLVSRFVFEDSCVEVAAQIEVYDNQALSLIKKISGLYREDALFLLCQNEVYSIQQLDLDFIDNLEIVNDVAEIPLSDEFYFRIESKKGHWGRFRVTAVLSNP